jgi:2-polyprenyl-6-hydroxyphenyl methylase/3-demethylubiquinone-9 3-methyltransferase
MDVSGYRFENESHSPSHKYLLPSLTKILKKYAPDVNHSPILDLGCGNGSVTNQIRKLGYKVVGIDPSEDGIEIARKSYPEIEFIQGDSKTLNAFNGTQKLIYSLEVIKHIYNPYEFMNSVHSALQSQGIAIFSTPYHGYFKNVLIAILGKFDDHVTALWRNGHIKFWSRKTFSVLITECGFEVIEFRRVGRVPPLAKSMIFVIRKKC